MKNLIKKGFENITKKWRKLINPTFFTQLKKTCICQANIIDKCEILIERKFY